MKLCMRDINALSPFIDVTYNSRMVAKTRLFQSLLADTTAAYVCVFTDCQYDASGVMWHDRS